MYSRVIVLLFCCCVWSGARAETVLLLGDSLSAAYGIPREASWPELLRQHLAAEDPPRQLVNASISGETSAGGRSRIDDLLAEHQPSLLLLELGGNDGLRGLPPARLADNLGAIMDAAIAQGAAVLLFEMQIPPNYGPRYTAAFEAVYGELVAARPQATLLPFFLREIAADENRWFLEDGIHPNAEAQPLLLKTVLGALSPDLRSASPDHHRIHSAPGSSPGSP